MATLTPDQKRRIEENRRLALERRNEKLKQQKTLLSEASGKKNELHQSNTSVTKTVFKPKALITSNEQVSSKNNVSFPPSFSSFFKGTTTTASSSHNNPSNFYKKPSTNPEKPKTWNVTTEAMTGTCSLISKDRFEVTINYNKDLIELFKTVPGKEYDPQRKSWNFPVEQYDHLKELVTPLSPNVIIGNLPKIVVQHFVKKRNPTKEVQDIDLSRIEPTLLNTLFPFQMEGVRFGISKGGRCLIADDMGLGKTIQSLGIADYYYNDWPLLIVCPSSMRFQWQEEVLHYITKIPSYSIFVIENSKDYIDKNAKVVIISYDLMSKIKEFLSSFGFGIVILDESHFLKNIKTQRTKAALEIVRKSKRCVLLSGTPALSRPAELFSQIKAVNSSLFSNMIEFGVRYCEGKQDKFGWNFFGSSHLTELKIILDEMVMIRRLKNDVLDQLPSKIRRVVTLDPSLVDTKNKTIKSLEKKLHRIKDSQGKERRSTLLAYYSETGKIKIKGICQHVEELLEQEQKFLLFAHHKDVMDAVCETLEKLETYYIRIDGKVSSDERKNVCDQFQEEEKFKVAVLSITAANTGITLTAAQLVIFAELYWNPGELIQAEDRAHRIGQKGSVLVHYLIAKGTADDQLWPMVQSKLNILQKAGLSKDGEIGVYEVNSQSSQQQSTILSFFSEMEEKDVTEDDLVNLMDEIEGVPEKKSKLQ